MGRLARKEMMVEDDTIDDVDDSVVRWLLQVGGRDEMLARWKYDTS